MKAVKTSKPKDTSTKAAPKKANKFNLGAIEIKEEVKSTEKRAISGKIDENLMKQVDAYGHWNVYSQAKVIEMALDAFFKSLAKPVEPLPDHVAAKRKKK